MALNRAELIHRGRNILETFKQDGEARFELRQMAFAVCIGLGVVYLLYVFTLQGKQKLLRAEQVKYMEASGVAGDGRMQQLLSDQMAKLAKKKERLHEENSVLRFRKKLLLEQYGRKPGGVSFANVIFTLLPLTPVDIENGLVQMNVQENQTLDFYTVSPVRLEGDVEYPNFLYYLQYLEKRPEVGMIGDLVLSMNLKDNPFTDDTKVHFGLTLGRISLHGGTR